MKAVLAKAVIAGATCLTVSACGVSDREATQAQFEQIAKDLESVRDDADGAYRPRGKLSTTFEPISEEQQREDREEEERRRERERERREEATMAAVEESQGSNVRPTTDVSSYERR